MSFSPSAPLSTRQDAPPPPPPSLSAERLTLAPVYFGSVCGWLFMGLMLAQFYTYHVNFSKDPIWIKSLVWVLVLIVLGQVASETFAGYHCLVGGWGDIDVIIIPPKTLILDPCYNAILAFVVQHFFVWRIWNFQRHAMARLVCLFISILSIIQTVGGIAITAIFFSIDVQSRLAAETQVYNLLWLICGATADISIAICMTLILQNARSRTFVATTHHALDKLIRLTIQTGALTAFLAIVILILFTQESKIGLMQTLAGFMLGKSYVISLLANLNTRVNLMTPKNNAINTEASLQFTPRKRDYFVGKLGALSFLSTRDVVLETGTQTADGGQSIGEGTTRYNESGFSLTKVDPDTLPATENVIPLETLGAKNNIGHQV